MSLHLLVPRQTATFRLAYRVNPEYRVWIVLIASFATVVGVAPIIDPDSFDQPIYATITSMLPLVAWGVMWLSVAAVCFLSVLTRSTKLWRVGGVGAVAMSGTWTAAVMWEKFINGQRLTMVGIALWGFFLSATYIATVKAGQYEVEIRRTDVCAGGKRTFAGRGGGLGRRHRSGVPEWSVRDKESQSHRQAG